MKIKKLIPLIIATLILSVPCTYGQSTKVITDREQTWFGYFNQTRFTNKIGWWTDLHVRRTDDFLTRPSLGLVRSGVIFYISDQARFIMGYAYAHNYPAAGFNTAGHEHRPWQMLQWTQPYKYFSLSQNIRLEQRYRKKIASDVLVKGYDFNYRLRYNFSLAIPLTSKGLKPKAPFASLSNEVLINLGNEIVYNHFDQMRLYGGIGYQFTAGLQAQVGYMNIFQQQATGNKFLNTHIIRLYLIHNLDLRTNDEQ